MKKFIIILCIVLMLGGSLAWYADRYLFPTRIKSFIIEALKEQTGKEVMIEALRFNVFRGVVFRNLSVYDGKKVLLYVKEGSCGFLFLPFLKKKIVIPVLNLKAAELVIEREKSGWVSGSEALVKNRPRDSRLFIYKIRFIDSRIIVVDKTLEPALATKFDKINLTATLYLPSKIKLSFYSLLGRSPAASIEGQGEYRFGEKAFVMRAQLHNFSPADFKPYYEHLAVNLPEGSLDARISLAVQNSQINSLVTAQVKNVLIEKEKVKFRMNGEVTTELRYNLEDRKLAFSGKADLVDSRILNFGLVDEISGISGRLLFKETGIDSQNLKASLWGLSLDPCIKVENLGNPEITASVETQEKAPVIATILKEKFKLNIPFETLGLCRVSISAKSGFSTGFNTQYAGFIEFQGATFKIGRLPHPLESVRGKLEFGNDELKWQALRFTYSGKPFRSQGSLKRLAQPTVKLQVSGDDLYFDTFFKIADQAYELLGFSGRLGNSKLSLAGQKNYIKSADLDAELDADLDLDLQDLGRVLPVLKNRINKAKPEGLLHCRMTLRGKLDQFLSWELYSKVTGPFISAYGVRGRELGLLYKQKEGKAEITDLSLALYDGTVRAQANLDLASASLPFTVTLEAQDIKLDQLAKNTGLKQKDISGVVNGSAKLNGYVNEFSKINGSGKIFITQGNLWQLNLFQGLGSLLFTKDFAKINFTEGYCNFQIEDKSVFTDNLVFKSTITNLYGPMKMNFNGALEGSLTIEILDASAPLSGTFKDVTTAVIGRAGRFGVLRISGSVNDPKYKFKPAVGDIFKGIKDSIIN